MWRKTSTPPYDYLTFTNLTLHNTEGVLHFLRALAITLLEFCPENIFVNFV